jgi:tetratricopeptide (TPR) repeat protein
MGRKQKNLRPQSGAAGGPATTAGIDFQVDFAVCKALDAISRYVVNPLEEMSFSMEPRVISEDGAVTLWDLRIGPPDTVTEAKLQPKKAEVVDWLDNVNADVDQGGHREFELMYGRGALPIIRAIERLKRLADESMGDANEFAKRVALERNKETDEVLSHLKTEAHTTLMRLRVTPTDPTALVNEIQLRLRLLMREPHRQSLYDLLTRKFRAGIKTRTAFKLQDLVKEAVESGIEFCTPQAFEPNKLDPVVADAVYILQRCENGLPGEVLAESVGVTELMLNEHLAPYVENRILTCDDNLWAIVLRKPLLVHSSGPQLVGKALRYLLEYYRANKKLPQGRRQVLNAIALAKACETDVPELVAELLWRLDKALKQTGNKRLVREVADLSIAAANRSATEIAAKGKAVALICGRSWALQRMGRLHEAREAGEESLELGQALHWDRNTAYCYKCLGRLYRMEAEKNRQNKAECDRLIALSVEWLNQAIALFPNINESNLDRAGEVGDCYCLLGRTYLVAGNNARAEKAARESLKLLTDETSKDFADLQILLGDMSARRDAELARSFYDKAIEVAGVVDAERSEIAARAYYRRGRLLKSAASLDKAAEIWERLEEDGNAADAHWHSLVLSERVPKEAQAVLETAKPAVRVEAIRMHEARLAELVSPSRGRRSKTDKSYWLELIGTAEQNVAIRQRES